MKRTTFLLPLLALTVGLASCSLPPLPAQMTSGVTETTDVPTVETTEAATTSKPTSPSSPPLQGTPAEAAARFLLTEGIVDCSKREYSHAELSEDLSALVSTYPDWFSVEVIGYSVAGRELYLGILGNPNAEKQILVSAGIHGREYLTPLLVMKQIEFYLTYYTTGHYEGIPYATLFEECCLYIAPMCNPDGIMLSQEGLSSVSDPALRAAIEQIYAEDFADEMTGQTEIDSYLQYWKANVVGTDLNRNFDALWEEYRNMNRPCVVNYKGPYAESEPETRALVALTDRLPNVQAVLCIHSQGEVLYWNCGQEGELARSTLAFTNAIADRTGYLVKQEQNNDASYSDWCALERELIAVTVETGLGMCPLDLDKFPPIWEDNFDLLALSAHYFLSP